MRTYEYSAVHTFEPVYDSSSRVLILGSFPSVKSREYGFYYGHPQNRFWKVLSAVLECDVPETIEQKTAMLLQNHIALWDVVAQCDIIGSSDASIRNIVPSDINSILSSCNLRAIFANGKTAEKFFCKYHLPECGRSIISLPSTSAANAAWSMLQLIDKWQVIQSYI